MKNKVLVKLNIPSLDITYDVFLPVNEVMWKLKKLMVRGLRDLIDAELNENVNCLLVNKDNGRIYFNNEILINTDIRNATELILVINNF